jgi:RHS repeat-associated protein
VEYVNGKVSNEYIYAGPKLLATVAGTAITYHHPDHLSNRAETNKSGTVTRTFGHFPFGEIWYETGTADKWKFTSYEHDSGTGETGLDYAQFRYYASGQGRFMSADSMGGHKNAPQSLNRYARVGNDPINLADPLGLFWVSFEQSFCVNSGDGDVCGTDVNWVWFDDGPQLPNLAPEPAAAPQPGPFVLRMLQVQRIIDQILNGNNPCADFFNSNSLVGPYGASGVYDNLRIQIQDNSAGTYTSTAAISEQGSAFQSDNSIIVWTNSPFGRPMQPANYRQPGPPALLHVGSYLGGSEGADVLMMLHELAHIVDLIPPDGRAADATGQQTKINEKNIEDNCDDAVRAAGASPGLGL